MARPPWVRIDLGAARDGAVGGDGDDVAHERHEGDLAAKAEDRDHDQDRDEQVVDALVLEQHVHRRALELFDVHAEDLRRALGRGCDGFQVEDEDELECHERGEHHGNDVHARVPVSLVVSYVSKAVPMPRRFIIFSQLKAYQATVCQLVCAPVLRV